MHGARAGGARRAQQLRRVEVGARSRTTTSTTSACRAPASASVDHADGRTARARAPCARRAPRSRRGWRSGPGSACIACQSIGPGDQRVRAERAAEHARAPRARRRAARRGRSPVAMPISCSIETRSSVAMLPVAPAGPGSRRARRSSTRTTCSRPRSAASTLARPWPRVLWKCAVSSTSAPSSRAARRRSSPHLHRVGHPGRVAEADLRRAGRDQPPAIAKTRSGGTCALVRAAEADADDALARAGPARGARPITRSRPRSDSSTDAVDVRAVVRLARAQEAR